MSSSLFAAGEAVVEMQMPPIAYGIIAFTLLIALLMFTWGFRSVWTRRK
ncbi:MAG TPA: hypothetical protein VK054_10240 [Beutenbergiaceae bacterium]|nr:hypothetical protein [Beutenbergiaceae bacterium]